MSVQTDFEKEFETEEYEMLILVQASCKGAAIIKDMLKPSIDFLASIDLRTGQFFHEKGRIEWLIKNDNKRNGWGYDFEQFGIYRVVVRKCIPQKLQPYQLHYMNNRYMLIRVLEENASNEKLEALKEHYSKPISTENELGTFVLEREFSWFEAASRTKKNCSVKCIGTGWTGIVILRKAPTAMRAVNSPPSVRSLISHRFINMLCPSKPSWLPVCRSIRRYQQAFPA